MTETTNDDTSSEIDNGPADAISATVIMTATILGVIHFVYTGGLPKFFSLIF